MILEHVALQLYQKMKSHLSRQLQRISTADVSTVVLVEVFQLIIHINGPIGIFIEVKSQLNFGENGAEKWLVNNDTIYYAAN